VLEKQEFAGYIISLRNVSDFKKLDQVKSNFLATVSHELKTPLASINYSLKLLQDQRIGEMNTEQQQLISTIKQENQRLQKMVSELLDVSRIETGNIQLNIEHARLPEIVRFALEPIQIQLQEKNIHLETSIPDDLPAVKADVEKTVWVLLNLISNAIRYSAENDTIEIAAKTDKSEVVVSVKDNGPGIEQQNHEKIFHKFVQIPGKAEYKGGAGLGLSISREFIQSQGGRIWVESALGKGSTFLFTLPVIFSTSEIKTSKEKQDYSRVIFDTFYSANKPVRINLKNGKVMTGKFVGFIHGVPDSHDPFVIKWHVMGLDEEQLEPFGEGESGVFLNQEDIVKVEFQ